MLGSKPLVIRAEKGPSRRIRGVVCAVCCAVALSAPTAAHADGSDNDRSGLHLGESAVSETALAQTRGAGADEKTPDAHESPDRVSVTLWDETKDNRRVRAGDSGQMRSRVGGGRIE
jgi:hypothetical protein